MKILNRLHTFRGTTVGELVNWAALIVDSEAIDLFNKERAGHRHPHALPAHENLQALGDGPQTEAARADRARFIADLLSKILDEKDRLMVQWHLTEGLTLSEIAERQGCSHAAMLKRWQRLLPTLKPYLEREHG